MSQYNALKYPIRIVQGNDWQLDIVLSTRVDTVKTPINITNTTFAGVVRVYRDDVAVAATVTCTKTDAVNGKVSFSLTDTQTLALPLGELYYQIDKTVNNSTQTILAGTFTVK